MKAKIVISTMSIALLIVFLLSSCIFAPSDDTFQFKGSNPECYTVVLHTVLGTNSGDAARITILDVDNYGRVMFSFVGISTLATEKAWLQGIFIHHGVQDNRVFYKEDGQFLIWEVPLKAECTLESVMEHCSEDDLSGLKEAHGWNTPLPQELDCREIIRKNTDPHKKSIREVYFSKYSSYYRYAYDILLDTDASGRTIYFLREFKRDVPDGQEDGKGFLMMVLPDGTVSAFEEVKDLLNYREQLIAFKNSNGWERITVSIETE